MSTSRIAAPIARQALLLASLLFAGAGCAAVGGSAAASDHAGSLGDAGPIGDAGYFWHDLAAYGQWVDYAPYGWCWVPDDVLPTWRPYMDGAWAYTDLGYCWASAEPWGWATDHYGRWTYDEFYGWIWVPGTVWAPAWVGWRYGDDWIGWAPLPPDALWDASYGLRFDRDDGIPSGYWCFVHRRHFFDHKLRSRVVPVTMNARLMPRTKDATRFTLRNGRPADDGVDVHFVDDGGRVKVHKVTLVDVTAPGKARGAKVAKRLAVFRPSIGEDALDAGPPEALREHARTVSGKDVASKFDRRHQELEKALQRNQAALRSEHQRELQAVPSDSLAALQRRQAAERQAQDQRAEAARRRLEERRQREVANVRPERPTPSERGGDRSKKRGGRH